MGPNNFGSSRHHLLRSVKIHCAACKQNYIDIYHMHGFDGNTPVDETAAHAGQLDTKRQSALYSLFQFLWLAPHEIAYPFQNAMAEQNTLRTRLTIPCIDREFEWELMPLGA